MQFVYFLGRFHVVFVHLPIGFIIALVLIEWLARKEKYRHLESAVTFLWGLAAIAAVITAALGYMHFAEGGFTGWSARYHRIFGTLVAITAVFGWVLRANHEALYKRAQLPLTIFLFLFVLVAGHTGGNLTHGASYLVQLAPGPIRSLAGIPASRPKATDLSMADPYLDVVQPIFEDRCSSCHGEDIQKNNLSLITYSGVIKGGKSGADVVPEDMAHSELFRRISLPKDDKDFMPAEGKPPLTDAETKIIGWWIQAGAPTATTVAKLTVPADIQPLLAAKFAANSAAVPETATIVAVGSHPADPKLMDNIASAGFAVRQVSLDNPHLIVSANGGGKPVTQAALQVLLSASDQIDELDLQRSNIEDDELAMIAQMPNLSHLRLDGNHVTDKGLRKLASLKKLAYLNLYGNQGVTDAAMPVLAQMPALERVYLWNTQATDRAAKSMRKRRPSLIVDVGGDLLLPSVSADTRPASEARGSTP